MKFGSKGMKSGR